MLDDLDADTRQLLALVLIATDRSGALSRHLPGLHDQKDHGGKGLTGLAKAAAKAATEDPAATKKLSDEQLAERFHHLSTQDTLDEPALIAITDEMDRRDRKRVTADAKQARTDARIDKLIAAGYTYRDAWAEAHHADTDELAQQENASAVDVARRPGERREQTVRRLYDEQIHLQWIEAEKATRGHLLTREAQARGVDPVALFSGPAARARKWASEDLKRFWADHPRVTYTEFRADMLGRRRDRAAAERIRTGGNDRDFGI